MTAYESFIEWLESGAGRESHRSEFSDVEWAMAQPKGPPNFKLGDVVRFWVGGFGIITEVSKPQGGWPTKYATRTPDGMKGHATGKCAWHYEEDFAELVGKIVFQSLDHVDPINRPSLP